MQPYPPPTAHTTTPATNTTSNPSLSSTAITLNSTTIRHLTNRFFHEVLVNNSRHRKYNLIKIVCLISPTKQSRHLKAKQQHSYCRHQWYANPPTIPMTQFIPLLPMTPFQEKKSRAGGVTTPQADLLASKSNYELISSGQHLEMGLHFSTAMATGVMMKRATHRAAEQARRDRMKTAMVDLAEFLLDGEVTFGSGTTCFVIMRGRDGDKMDSTEGDDAAAKKGEANTVAGEKKTVNKARLIEMALEKMKAQEREIELLRKEIEALRVVDRMDES
ncbi:hypothetical protein PTNB73_08222 [Pyrenophora teres f. teres]|uniref:Uncharacterized protein n=1 Tax=Pyrenophora teres f. teres TaxID=97479 RepID=A0A6S6W7X6_9PLEO|nr:hypothetical protein PTNB85_05652 [Pyrenophora teres f. teres]KAE8844198.1 hypothetical protein HRS9122_05301 [Pyrenophora teres f. teres]KAE8858742.1 hypothetical protein PTNB73_08222 [Pyrenophora teres f. teres]KAE8860607.1 hypothetical protein PTNB29_05702 [Pyrenophora teres f. teres]CAE7196449.1 hypothetical protein PTTW11_08364 [Pyrenophora teres f. teres]